MSLSLLPGRNNVVRVFPVTYLSMHANLTCIFGSELFLFYLCLYYISLSDPYSHVPEGYQNAAP
jgi:hypothetical protein